jgi:hypothetical protein
MSARLFHAKQGGGLMRLSKFGEIDLEYDFALRPLIVSTDRYIHYAKVKTQEEKDYDDAMAELDEEFRPIDISPGVKNSRA